MALVVMSTLADPSGLSQRSNSSPFFEKWKVLVLMISLICQLLFFIHLALPLLHRLMHPEYPPSHLAPSQVPYALYLLGLASNPVKVHPDDDCCEGDSMTSSYTVVFLGGFDGGVGSTL